MILKVNKKVLKDAVKIANIVVAPDGTLYLNIPYWYKIIDDTTVEELSFDKLPQELIDIIKKQRNP